MLRARKSMGGEVVGVVIRCREPLPLVAGRLTLQCTLAGASPRADVALSNCERDSHVDSGV